MVVHVCMFFLFDIICSVFRMQFWCVVLSLDVMDISGAFRRVFNRECMSDKTGITSPRTLFKILFPILMPPGGDELDVR